MVAIYEKDGVDISKLISNKKYIHRLIYEEELERCPMHQDIETMCNEKRFIKEIIENPKIFGFFMYQFPRDTNESDNEKEKIKKENYKSEISKIKELINEVNKDPIIDIKDALDVTGQDVAICKFCKIARSYDFGILLMTPKNVNAFLEAGMFMSLGKKVIFLNNASISSEAPFDVRPYIRVDYHNLEELEREWNLHIPEYFENLKGYYLTIEPIPKKPRISPTVVDSRIIIEQIENFREERIKKIKTNDTPVLIHDNAKLVLHLISTSSFISEKNYDVSQLEKKIYSALRPLSSADYRITYELDGIVSYSKFDNELRAYSYLQVFKNGIIEVVDPYLLRIRNEKEKKQPRFLIRGIEWRIIKHLPNFIKIFNELGIETPIYIYLSLVGVKNYIIWIPTNFFLMDRVHPFNKDIILLPKMKIEDFSIKPAILLKPCFDSLWNAAGLERSFSYDKNGNYIQPQ